MHTEPHSTLWPAQTDNPVKRTVHTHGRTTTYLRIHRDLLSRPELLRRLSTLSRLPLFGRQAIQRRALILSHGERIKHLEDAYEYEARLVVRKVLRAWDQLQ